MLQPKSARNASTVLAYPRTNVAPTKEQGGSGSALKKRVCFKHDFLGVQGYSKSMSPNSSDRCMVNVLCPWTLNFNKPACQTSSPRFLLFERCSPRFLQLRFVQFRPTLAKKPNCCARVQQDTIHPWHSPRICLAVPRSTAGTLWSPCICAPRHRATRVGFQEAWVITLFPCRVLSPASVVVSRSNSNSRHAVKV